MGTERTPRAKSEVSPCIFPPRFPMVFLLSLSPLVCVHVWVGGGRGYRDCGDADEPDLMIKRGRKTCPNAKAD